MKLPPVSIWCCAYNSIHMHVIRHKGQLRHPGSDMIQSKKAETSVSTKHITHGIIQVAPDFLLYATNGSFNTEFYITCNMLAKIFPPIIF